MQKFIIKVTQNDLSVLEKPQWECFILSDQTDQKFIEDFAAKAKTLDKIVLSQSAQICTKYNLDGVVVDLSKSENIAKDYHMLTEGLKNKFVGAICRSRRHEAMLVSECEPDFVIFNAWKDGLEKTLELTEWYAEMFLIRCAVLPQDDLDYTLFKTDFVILNDTCS